MDETRRREYLRAMGVERWVLRPEPGEPQPEPSPVQPSPVPAGPAVGEGVPPPSAPDSGTASGGDRDLPAWLLEEPPQSDDYIPAREPAEYPADLEPAVGPVTDLSALGWDELRERVGECRGCELHRSRANTVFGVGDPAARLLVIGEAPGADEDRQGEPFVGRAGQLLNAMLAAIGLRRDQVFIANILKCRPPGNRDPRAEEVQHCEPYLRRQIELLAPRVILCVGRVAAQNLLQSGESVGRMRGKALFYREIPTVVTYHPAYLLRSPEQKAKAWADLQAAYRKLTP
ncbi:MAG: uracil-DNA glycosylase [gamma proteobacterium symbiont of Phacoides pectinatus]